jgi:WD40 repeat protein
MRWLFTALTVSACFFPPMMSDANPDASEIATITTPSPVDQFRIAQGGRLAAGYCEDGFLRIWRLPDDELMRSIEVGTNDFRLIALSRDGRLLLTTQWNGETVVWDTSIGKSVFHRQFPHYLSGVAFSRDDRYLAVASSFWPVQVIDLAGNTNRCELGATTGGTHGVSFSPDGHCIATADADSQIRVYDSRSGKLIASREEFLMNPFTIDFTADGKEVVAGGADKVTVFFSAETGQVIKRLKKQKAPVGYVEVSADNKSLATMLFDGTVMIWDINSGRKLSEWPPPPGLVGWGPWSAEGHFLTATATTNAVHVWQSN